MGCRRREAVVHKTTIGISQCMPGTAQNHGTITTWLDVRGEMYSRRDIWARVRDGAHLWTIWQMIIPKPLDEMASVQTLSLSIIDFINPIYQHFYVGYPRSKTMAMHCYMAQLFSAKQPPEAILTWCDIEGAMENKFGTSFTKEAHARFAVELAMQLFREALVCDMGDIIQARREGNNRPWDHPRYAVRRRKDAGAWHQCPAHRAHTRQRRRYTGQGFERQLFSSTCATAHLTQDECDAIEQNPLGDSLSAVREALREAESKIPNEASESHDSNDPERPRLFTAPIGTLL